MCTTPQVQRKTSATPTRDHPRIPERLKSAHMAQSHAIEAEPTSAIDALDGSAVHLIGSGVGIDVHVS